MEHQEKESAEHHIPGHPLEHTFSISLAPTRSRPESVRPRPLHLPEQEAACLPSHVNSGAQPSTFRRQATAVGSHCGNRPDLSSDRDTQFPVVISVSFFSSSDVPFQ